MSATFQEKVGLAGELTPERLRFWGIRSTLSVLDQGLTSGAGFLLNLFLARWLTSESYGAFAVGFATLLFLSGYHNVLLLEPMTVLGPAKYSGEMTGYFLAQLKVHGILVAALSGAILLAVAVMAAFGAQHALVMATASSAVALPFVLLFWLVRRMCYVVQRPGIAVSASAGYLALVLVGTFALHTKGWLDVAGAFLLMTGASVIAAVAPLRKLGLLGTGGSVGSPWKTVAAENWRYGRWLVASTALFAVVNQSQMFIVAGFLGLGAAGALRAIQVPSLMMIQVITAIGLLILPTFAYEFGSGQLDRLRHNARVVSLGLAAFTLTFAGLIALSAIRVEGLLYGGKFAAYAHLMPVLVLMATAVGITQGYGMALRAARKPQFDLVSNAIAAPVAIASAFIFTRWWGMAGTVASIVLGFSAQCVVTFFYFLNFGPHADKVSGLHETSLGRRPGSDTNV